MADSDSPADPNPLDFIDQLEYDELRRADDPRNSPIARRPNRSCDDQRCCSSHEKGNGVPLSQELEEADRRLFNPPPTSVRASSSVIVDTCSNFDEPRGSELFLRLDDPGSVGQTANESLATPSVTVAPGLDYVGGEELQYENEFVDEAVEGCSRETSGYMDASYSMTENENEQLLLEGIWRQYS